MVDNHVTLANIHDDVLGWTNQLLAEQGIAPAYTLQPVCEQAWSLVCRVEHPAGTWYFKHLPEYFAHEIRLTEYLSAIDPNHVAGFIGKDETRRFLMVNDAGPMLRERYSPKPEPRMWLEALSAYAHLQIKMMTDTAFQRLPIPDRSLLQVPALIERPIHQYVQDNSDVETEQLRESHLNVIDSAIAQWPELVSPLYRYGITDTLNHGDLHDGNLAFDQHAVLFDWGDASKTHPFMSLRSVLSNISRAFGIAEHDPQMEPFIQAYLQPWTQFADITELRAMLETAKKVWALVSFLSWQHALQNHNDPRAVSYHYALPAILRRFADDQGQ